MKMGAIRASRKTVGFEVQERKSGRSTFAKMKSGGNTVERRGSGSRRSTSQPAFDTSDANAIVKGFLGADGGAKPRTNSKGDKGGSKQGPVNPDANDIASQFLIDCGATKKQQLQDRRRQQGQRGARSNSGPPPRSTKDPVQAHFEAMTKDKAKLNQFKRDVIYGDYKLEYAELLDKQAQDDKHRYMDVIVHDESPTYMDDADGSDVRDLRDKGRISSGSGMAEKM